MTGVWMLLTMSVLAAQPAAAEAVEADVADGSEGYCAWLEGVAEAESSLLMGPQLFASGGVVNSLTGEGTETIALRPRLSFGVQYDFVRLYQGYTLRDRAAAECRAFRASQRLAARLDGRDGEALTEALAARAAVLARALPKAEAILSRLRVELAEARGTLSELQATELKVDGLRALALQTAREQAALAAQVTRSGRDGGGEGLSTLLEERRTADLEAQRLSARMREASAYSLSVRTGYDRVFGLERSAPFVGMVNLSYNLGGLFQPSAHARAESGRRRWAEREVRDAEGKGEQLHAELRAVQEVERARLAQTAALLAELDGRLRDLEGLSAEPARRLAELLWFEQVKLQAEHAWLAAHTSAIARLLGEDQEGQEAAR